MFKKALLMFWTLWAGLTLAWAQVNINTASEQELQTINGIGRAKAQAIVVYRNANGPFKSVEDLKNVRGIGRGVTYERIAPQVTVRNNPSAKTQNAQPAVTRPATANPNNNRNTQQNKP